MSAAALTREIAEAGVGVGRLIRYDPRWPQGFDPTVNGFLRSFLGPLLGLPFYLVVANLIASGQDVAIAGPQSLWVAGISHVINAIAYPALIAAFARPLGIGPGYGAFVVVVNWASLFLNMAMAAASLLTLAGKIGFSLFFFAWFILFCASLFITWRAARETLSSEIAPAVLMVVLSVAVGVATDQLAALLVRFVSP